LRASKVLAETPKRQGRDKPGQTARKALAELAAIGWTVSEYAKGKWVIRRPAQPS
jgi:hypothetical protein